MQHGTKSSHESEPEKSRHMTEEFEEVHQISKHASEKIRLCRSPTALWLIQLEDDIEEHFFDDDDLEKAINLSLQPDSGAVEEEDAITTDATSNCRTANEEASTSARSNDQPSNIPSGVATQVQPTLCSTTNEESTISPSRDKGKRKAHVLNKDHITSFSEGCCDTQSLLSDQIAALFEPQDVPDSGAQDVFQQISATGPSPEMDNSTLIRERCLLGDRYSGGKAQINPDRPRGCRICLKVPVLPERPLRFKVVRSACSHFVAVSYCWPEPSRTVSPTYSYRRVFEDGTSREWVAKPPDEIMDRAVAFARACDIRQIWIDRVCTSSDRDSDEYQFDLQANASIFKRAYACIGLLDSTLLEQRLMISLSQAVVIQKAGISSTQTPRICRDVLEFLRTLAYDRFYDRAWTLQECVSARPTLVLAIRTGIGVSFLEDVSEVIAVPQVVTGSFLFTYDEIFTFIKCFKRLYAAYLPFEMRLSPELVKFTLTKLKNLQPELPQSNDTTARSFSAALAITYLRHRHASCVEDCTAILANLCGYRHWIDTRDTQQFQSLSCAYLALATINGDLSLLVPELSQTTTRLQTSGNLRTLWPCRPSELIACIQSYSHRTGSPTAVEFDTGRGVYEISKTDFRCPATIWRVEERIDLRKVQRDRQKDWNSLWCVRCEVRPLDERETLEEYKHRVDWVEPYLEAHRDQIMEGWRDEVTDKNVTITRVFNESILSERGQGPQIISRILFEILVEIQRSGLDSLANSIWLSLRVDQLPWLASEDQNLPDTWAEVMGNTRLIWRVTDLFDLEWDAHGTFRQDWIVERVMSDGYLWYGKAQDGLEHLNKVGRKLAKLQDQGFLTNERIEPILLPPKPGTFHQNSLLGRAHVRHVAIRTLREMFPTRDEKTFDELLAGTFFAVGAIGAPKAGWFHHDLEGELAAFDVGKRCLIAIPLDAGLERLPHPPERSMSVCWIVESVNDEANQRKGDFQVVASSSERSRGKSKHSGKKHQRFRVNGKVKGCWPLMECFPMTKYSFLHV